MDTIHGQRVERFWDGDGYRYELFIEHPVNHKGKLCYGIRDKIIQEMRVSGGKTFTIKGKTWDIPNEILLKDMRKEGFSSEVEGKYPENPMIFYYFVI